MSVPMHPTLQKRFASLTDLTPIEFHALWGHSNAQFLEGRMLHSLILNQPQYWLSIPDRTLAGLWTFGPKFHGRVQETTLLTMIDDVTGELAYHVYLATQTDNKYIGFTVNLRMDKHTNVGAVAREFYFEARAVDVEGRKVGVECRVFDAQTSAVLMTARAMFVFMSFAQISKRSANTQSVPYEMQPQISGSCDIDTDLRGLDRVMNFLPPNTVTHSNGSLNTHTRTLVVGLDFGPNISGPPIYVHGGILATVLYNASEFLFAKSLGVEDDLINASVRDVNYYKGVPLECRNVTIDASVEAQDEKQVVVFAKLMQGPHVFTTLKTTFTLQSSTSSKL
ncbi:hypothetical protein IW148_005080 [Coemansia sp. RSA 1199]|nr:hypothetical protein IW148_005080 [Coemansia sp. RSA 1199]